MSFLAALLLGAAEFPETIPQADCPQVVALRDAATDDAAFARLLAGAKGPRVFPLHCGASGWDEWACHASLLPSEARRDGLAAAVSACLPGAEVTVGKGQGWFLAPTHIRSGALLIIVEQRGEPRAHVGVSAEVVFVQAAKNRRTP